MPLCSYRTTNWMIAFVFRAVTALNRYTQSGTNKIRHCCSTRVGNFRYKEPTQLLASHLIVQRRKAEVRYRDR